MEGKIELTTRRQVTNKLRDAYRNGTKQEKINLLDYTIKITGLGRSTARKALTGPRLSNPKEQIDKRKLKPRQFSDEARQLLTHIWKLMGLPCGKYLVVMLP